MAYQSVAKIKQREVSLCALRIICRGTAWGLRSQMETNLKGRWLSTVKR